MAATADRRPFTSLTVTSGAGDAEATDARKMKRRGRIDPRSKIPRAALAAGDFPSPEFRHGFQLRRRSLVPHDRRGALGAEGQGGERRRPGARIRIPALVDPARTSGAVEDHEIYRTTGPPRPI